MEVRPGDWYTPVELARSLQGSTETCEIGWRYTVQRLGQDCTRKILFLGKLLMAGSSEELVRCNAR